VLSVRSLKGAKMPTLSIAESLENIADEYAADSSDLPARLKDAAKLVQRLSNSEIHLFNSLLALTECVEKLNASNFDSDLRDAIETAKQSLARARS
jgi:hypothetical protein